MKWRHLLASLLAITLESHASDSVPYTVESIRSVGNGYIHLVAPGKIQLPTGDNGELETYDYTGVVYIPLKNLGPIYSVTGVKDGCVISYESGSYRENISVRTQSCNEVIKVIGKAAN